MSGRSYVEGFLASVQSVECVICISDNFLQIWAVCWQILADPEKNTINIIGGRGPWSGPSERRVVCANLVTDNFL